MYYKLGRILEIRRYIQKTLEHILSFTRKNEETLVVFTSDHETGGLAAQADFNDYPNMQIAWTTRNHTSAVVPIFAKGPGAHYFADIHRNWETGKILKALISSPLTNPSN